LLVLCAAPFVDELSAGVPTLGAAEIRASFDAGYGAVVAAVLAVPLLLALFVESPLLLVAKRVGRRRMAAAGFVVMAAGEVAAAASASPWQLTICLACSAAAGGVALALIETAIMDAAPHEREVWMTRWTFGAALGDLAAPGLVAVAALAGFGWRGSFVVAGLMAAIAASVLPRQIGSEDDHAQCEPVAVGAAIRRALGNRRLLTWCAAATVCDLLDEIFIVMAVLFLREVRGMEAAGAALAIAAVPGASALGLLFAGRLLRRVQPLRYLVVNCVTCALAIGGFVWLPSSWAAVVLLGVIGFTAASMWPIATAQSYRALPEDSTAVAALDNLFMPLSIAMPVAIAAAADSWGLAVAVLLLAFQPLMLLAVAARERCGERCS
jgi:MFS family permease